MRSVVKCTKDILLLIGMPGALLGFKYLVEAIKMVIEDENYLDSITKVLYPVIAEKYDTKSNSVERAIRHAIGVSWNKDRVLMLNDLFGAEFFVSTERPSNGEFIALVAGKIQDIVFGEDEIEDEALSEGKRHFTHSFALKLKKERAKEPRGLKISKHPRIKRVQIKKTEEDPNPATQRKSTKIKRKKTATAK
ncbi:MAG: sporulation initiation factor Spo0A C-terminal domain-containing protein [Clostridia bacterium]|nr:sporulation initiation factor Spo0A C-terminal domain-containing protein [Clostridia bacterium]